MYCSAGAHLQCVIPDVAATFESVLVRNVVANLYGVPFAVIMQCTRSHEALAFVLILGDEDFRTYGLSVHDQDIALIISVA